MVFSSACLHCIYAYILWTFQYFCYLQWLKMIFFSWNTMWFLGTVFPWTSEHWLPWKRRSSRLCWYFGRYALKYFVLQVQGLIRHRTLNQERIFLLSGGQKTLALLLARSQFTLTFYFGSSPNKNVLHKTVCFRLTAFKVPKFFLLYSYSTFLLWCFIIS